MDTFSSWEFGAAEEESCGLCGMEKDSGNDCCRDEVKVLKLQQEISQAKALTYQIDVSLPVNTLSDYFYSSYQNIPPIWKHGFILDPPLLHSQELYLYHSVFRI